jgi:uncharacterized damage-inducible protein DinB
MAMITRTWLQMMARYNQWQNESLFSSAGGLSDTDRRADRGAFWGSIHGTLSHLLWADLLWMSRFGLVAAPTGGQKASADLFSDWAGLGAERRSLDATIISWADRYPTGPIDGELRWYSGSLGRETEAPLSVVLTHIFNHQTHHRGQAHALVTAAGATPGDTDLFLMPAQLWPTD